MNNYSCTKNFSGVPYAGQMKDEHGKPVTDPDHHVIYEDPKWSLAKTIPVLKTYYVDKKRRTALAIAEAWAPWCDTNGSHPVHLGWGRTCTDGRGPAPATFTGPRCTKPANGVPPKAQCGPCNCPNELASFYATDTDKGSSGDLHLFDAQGRPMPDLNPVLARVVWMEIGYRPTAAFIDAAVAAYQP